MLFVGPGYEVEIHESFLFKKKDKAGRVFFTGMLGI